MDVMTFVVAVAILWFALATVMSLAWLIEQRTGNSGWIDVTWTAGLGGIGVVAALLPSSPAVTTNRQWLIASLVLVWAVRLGWHISVRTTKITEDPRYRKLKLDWGRDASRNLFWLLQAQAALSVPMAVSIVLAAWNPAPRFTFIDLIAILLFIVALAGSATADRHLAAFKERTRGSGEVCDEGVWAWSRHPNYFFEWLIWLSVALFAIELSGNWLWGYLAFIGPICMFWLLRYVSGVPPLEQHMVAKYGERYMAYQQSTSVFFPVPPVRTAR